MKKLIIVASLLFCAVVGKGQEIAGTVSNVEASTAPVVMAPTDAKLKRLWDWTTDKGAALHLLDNGTAASLYDFQRHEWMGGAMTALYKPQMSFKDFKARPLSADMGIASTMQPNQVGAFPFLALRFHGREIAEQNATIKSFFDARTNLIKYLTCGGWAARDWYYGIYRYGYFVGAEASWGGK